MMVPPSTAKLRALPHLVGSVPVRWTLMSRTSGPKRAALALVVIVSLAAASVTVFSAVASGVGTYVIQGFPASTGASSLGGRVNNPNGLAVDASGNLYVADELNRVSKFDSSGAWVWAMGYDVVTGGGTGFETCTVAANCKTGVSGALGGQFNISTSSASAGDGDVAVDSQGNIYVADTDNNRIQKFTQSGSTVTWAAAYGADVITGGGTGVETCTVAANCKAGITSTTVGGAFSTPRGVGVGNSDEVFVADTGFNRVQRIDWSTTSAAIPTGPSRAPPRVAATPSSTRRWMSLR